MSWIDTVSYDDSTGKFRKLYDRIKGPHNNIDNIMMLHSLRPHSMEGHMAIYKYLLHHSSNRLPKWFLETLGVLVSIINECGYCVDHHFAGLSRLLADDEKAYAIKAAIQSDKLNEAPLSDAQKLAMGYAKKLTIAPASLSEADVIALRQYGLKDGEILEINQVCSYFSYANRTVLGLGCTTEGDIIGLSPINSNDPDDWSHTKDYAHYAK